MLSDYGPKVGKSYHETESEQADRETILSLLLRGEFSRIVGILEVDLTAGTARDVSVEFARELLERANPKNLPSDVALFATSRSGLAVVR